MKIKLPKSGGIKLEINNFESFSFSPFFSWMYKSTGFCFSNPYRFYSFQIIYWAYKPKFYFNKTTIKLNTRIKKGLSVWLYFFALCYESDVWNKAEKIKHKAAIKNYQSNSK